MNKLFKIHWLAALCGLTMLSLTACNDDDNPENKSPEVNPDINVNVETMQAENWVQPSTIPLLLMKILLLQRKMQV